MKDRPSPLDVLLWTMQAKWSSGAVDEAVALAKAAAPFVHPRAGASQKTVDFNTIKDDELNDLCDARSPGAGDAEGDPA